MQWFYLIMVAFLKRSKVEYSRLCIVVFIILDEGWYVYWYLCTCFGHFLDFENQLEGPILNLWVNQSFPVWRNYNWFAFNRWGGFQDRLIAIYIQQLVTLITLLDEFLIKGSYSNSCLARYKYEQEEDVLSSLKLEVVEIDTPHHTHNATIRSTSCSYKVASTGSYL